MTCDWCEEVEPTYNVFLADEEFALEEHFVGETGEFFDLVYDCPLLAPTPGELPGQLYDLESDLEESTNLWEELPDVVSHLQDLLDRYRREGRSRTAQNATHGN